MFRFTLGILVIITVIAGTWSVLDKHLVTAACYYIAAVYLYNRLEKDVFKE